MSATQQPGYLTSRPACVEEVGYLVNVVTEMVALAGDVDGDLLIVDELRHRLQVLVDLALARPSVRQARQCGGAR
jgi:hypothetical protein